MGFYTVKKQQTCLYCFTALFADKNSSQSEVRGEANEELSPKCDSSDLELSKVANLGKSPQIHPSHQRSHVLPLLSCIYFMSM